MFTLITLSGPLLGGLGYYLEYDILFWIGVVLAGFNFFMNVASGAMKFPILPLALVAVGLAFFPPWYIGAAIGLLVYTALEGISEIPSYFRKPRA